MQNEPQLSAEMSGTYIDPTKNRIKNLTDMRFGRLVAVKIVGNACKHMYWFCKCDCGGSKVVQSPHLISGATKSCGCLQTDTFTTHNLSDHRLYNIWFGMIKRCTNKKYRCYKYYGGRGITVCNEWLDIKNFIKDMDDGYVKGLSIDRINNDLGYFKENCRWATAKQQSRNKSNNKYITIDNVTKPLCDWIDESNLNKNTVNNRLHRGFSITQALGMEQL